LQIMSAAPPSYPGKVAMRRALQVARDNGIDVAGFEVTPEGVIRIIEARAVPQEPKSLYDKLVAAGRLG
jgi:glycosylphosphatidylinositol transamidase (GPIT) subunit GPI8